MGVTFTKKTGENCEFAVWTEPVESTGEHPE